MSCFTKFNLDQTTIAEVVSLFGVTDIGLLNDPKQKDAYVAGVTTLIAQKVAKFNNYGKQLKTLQIAARQKPVEKTTVPTKENQQSFWQKLLPAGLLTPSPEGTAERNKTRVADHIDLPSGKTLPAIFSYLGGFTTWFTSETVATRLGDTLTEAQIGAINNFKAFSNFAQSKFNVTKMFGKPGYFFPTNLGKTQETAIDNQDALLASDLFRQLLDENNQTTESVKTALTYAAYQAMLDMANTPSDKRHVATLLGIEPEEVTAELLRKYRYKTTHINTAYSKWGNYVFEALGLKAKPNSSENRVANFKTALGAQVYQLLRAMDYVEVEGVPRAQYLADIGAELNTEKETDTKFFYKLKNGKEGILTAIEAQKLARGVIGRFFGYENADVMPSEKPITKVPTKTKTGQAVPEFLQKVLEKFQSTPFAFKSNNLYHLLRFSDTKVDGVSLREKLLGVASNTEIKNSQSTKRIGMEAKNEGLRRELEALDNTFIAFGEKAVNPDKGFYLATDVWKMLRVGIKSVINPTSSKLHRYMITTKSWKADVQLGNTESENSYLLRVAEGFGVSTDKKANIYSLEEFAKFIEADVFKVALEAIKADPTTYSEEQANAILAVLDAAGFAGSERIKTFDALVSYSEFLAAKDTGQTTFTTDLMGEVDGVSNGPILTQLLFGVTAGGLTMVEMFAKGGFYTDGVNKDFNVWRGNEDLDNTDFYEAGSRAIKAAVSNNLSTGKLGKTSKLGNPFFLEMTPATQAFATAMAFFMNDKDGNILNRNKVKGLFNPVTFGSGFGKAAMSLLKGSPYGSLEDAIYAKIEELNEKSKDSEYSKEAYDADLTDLRDYIRDLGINLPMQDGKKNAIAWTITDFMENFEIDNQDRANMRNLYMPEGSFQAGLGTFIEAAINDYFIDFVAQREAITDVTTSAANNYVQARNYFIKAKQDEKGITYKEGEITVGLSAEELAEIDKQLLSMGITPVMESFYGQEENNSDAGLLLLKKTKGAVDSVDHQTQLTGSHPFVTGTNKHITGYSEGLVIDSPGVLGTSVGTHSLDSYISFKRMDELFKQGIASLNMHDSGGAGFAAMKAMAIEFNEATFKAMVGYSPMSAIADMGMKNLTGYIDFLVANPNAPVDTEALTAAFEVVQNLVDKAHIGTMEKLAFLKQVKHVSQYAFEGGSYEVTAQDVAAIDRKIAEVEAEYTKQLADLQITYGMIQNGFANPTEITTIQTTEAVEPTAPTEDPSDDGSPDNTGAVEDFFKEARDVEGAPMDTFLAKAYEKYQNVPFLTTLAKMLKGVNARVFVVKDEESVLNADDRFVLINAALLRRQLGQTLAGAFAVPTDTGTNIYVFADRNTSSPILVLHESLHALLSKYLVDTEESILKKKEETKKTNTDPKYTDAEKSYLNLESLYKDVKAAIEASPEFKDRLYAGLPELDNVDEFIAYGLTDSNFQRVLSEIQVKLTKEQTKQTYTNIFNRFIKEVADFFGFNLATKKDGTFNQSNTKALNNALVALFANSVNVMQDAKLGPDTERRTIVRAGQSASGLYTHSTLEVFEKLADPQNPLRADTTTHLTQLINRIVNATHGPFGTLTAARMQNTNRDEVGMYADALNAGELPIATSIKHAGLALSDQESFAIDQIAITLESGLNQPEMAKYHRTLEKLYVQAQATVKASDFFKGNWANATPAEKANAESLYNYIFDSSKTNGQAFIRFAAFGLASEQVIGALNKVQTKLPDVKIKNNLFSKLQDILTYVLNMWLSKTTGVRNGQTMDTSVSRLIQNLVAAEANRQEALNRPARFKKISEYFGVAQDYAKDKITNAARSNFIQNSPARRIPIIGDTLTRAIRVTGIATDLTVNGRVQESMQNALKLRNRMFTGKFGVTAGVINEILGETSKKRKFIRLLQLVKGTEATREQHIATEQALVLGAFKDGGKYLTKEQSKGLSTFLRTGISSSNYTAQQIQDFVTDPVKLQAEITRINGLISKETKQDKLIAYKAENLGNYLMTGNSTDITRTSMNATQLFTATVALTGDTKMVAKQGTLVPLITDLISLHAIQHMDSLDRKPLQDVLSVELPRGKDNGIAFVLADHKRLLKDAKERLFRGKDFLMQHGYLPEVVNPNVSVVYLTDNATKTKEQQAALLMKAGYSQVEVKIDPAQNHPVLVMVHSNLPETRRATGLFSLIDHKGKGAQIHNDLNDPLYGTYARIVHNKAEQISKAGYRKLMTNGFKVDLANSIELAVPLYNESGAIVNYRHTASTKFRNETLKRNNDFAFLLGKLHGTTYEKEATAAQNTQVVRTLKEFYDKEYKGNERDFYFVGLKSTDKEYNEAYRLLPYATRQEIESVWGEEGMFVRKDMLDLVFGYRKPNIGDAVLQAKNQQNLAIRGLVKVAEAAYARGGNADDKYAARVRAAILAKQIQRGWEEVVTETKDIIVIKTGLVLLGNETSNLSLLKLNGMGLIDAFREKGRAISALNIYRVQAEELNRLETYIATGTYANQHPEFAKRIGVLQESMSKNPVKFLIDLGFMPTISEDVETISEDYSYKGKLFAKLENTAAKARRLGTGVSNVSKQIYMSESTGAYQFMRYATQVSDFSARYALYQHLTKEGKLTEEEKLSQISRMFVNYDIPSHRAVEFMNAIGLVYFTKYFLRVQAPLLEQVRERPLNALQLMAFEYYLGGTDTIMDSVWTEKLYWPGKYGALEILGVPDDIATVNAAMTLGGALVPGE